MKTHWTAQSFKDYLYRIASDFIIQLENKMDSLPISQSELAKKLGVTKAAVSLWMKHPGNAKLGKMIEYAKALGMKVSVVAYEDDDPENKKGPIDADIFRICWEKSGKPRDFWDLEDAATNNKVRFLRRVDDVNKIFRDFKMREEMKGTLSDFPGCPSISIGEIAGNKEIEVKPS